MTVSFKFPKIFLSENFPLYGINMYSCRLILQLVTRLYFTLSTEHEITARSMYKIKNDMAVDLLGASGYI